MPEEPEEKGMAVTIWHNPRCSKSRAVLKLPRSKGIEPRIVEYLKEPPAAAKIRRALGLLKVEPRQLMRRRGPPYAALRLDEPELTPARLVAAMAANPILIERPVVILGRKAAIGRPPEAVLEVL